MCLVGETEVGGLHTEGQQHQNQCDIGIDIGDDTIVATGRRELCCIERNQ